MGIYTPVKATVVYKTTENNEHVLIFEVVVASHQSQKFIGHQKHAPSRLNLLVIIFSYSVVLPIKQVYIQVIFYPQFLEHDHGFKDKHDTKQYLFKYKYDETRIVGRILRHNEVAARLHLVEKVPIARNHKKEPKDYFC